jgi:hypothetical protein
MIDRTTPEHHLGRVADADHSELPWRVAQDEHNLCGNDRRRQRPAHASSLRSNADPCEAIVHGTGIRSLKTCRHGRRLAAVRSIAVAKATRGSSKCGEMRIGVGAGNIGQTLKAMLASVDGVTEITLADNAKKGDVQSMPAQARILQPSFAPTMQSSTRCPSTSIKPWLQRVPRCAALTSISQRTSNPRHS